MIARPAFRGVLATLVLSCAVIVPLNAVLAQDTMGEARLRKIEAEVRALQGKVFPGGAGLAPQSSPAGATSTAAPATTPVTDMLTRMDSLEASVARLTAQSEDTANRIRKLEARFPAPAATAAATPASAATPTPAATPTVPETGTAAKSNLSVMTKGASEEKPAASRTVPSKPSAARLAAVKAIAKPKTDDAGDDDYSYAFRLWEAKFYPEAAQQLKAFMDKYPKHSRMSYARNLMGRAYLDDGKPREAAPWFLQNYQKDKSGDRAPDSLLFLAESMSQLKDVSRACVALGEFSSTYPKEAAGRLKPQYSSTRAGVKCN